MNLHLDQQMADLGDSVTTLNICLPENAVFVPRMYNPLPARTLHFCRVVQERLSLQADVELSDWPQRAPDMNHNENMWSEVKRTIQETWPVLPPRNSDELWTLESDAGDGVASSQRYVPSLIEPVTRRMKSVVEAQGFWTSY